MYYEEKWDNGRLYWRGTPTGAWYPASVETLSERLRAAEALLKRTQTQFQAVGWWDGRNKLALWEPNQEPADGALLFRPVFLPQSESK
jgi:hypothetical protein